MIKRQGAGHSRDLPFRDKPLILLRFFDVKPMICGT
jgi:hypothetical protein